MSGFIHRDDITFDATAVGSMHDAEPPMECCGCPDSNACRQYCVANYGARGGYCEGFLDLRCVCIY